MEVEKLFVSQSAKNLSSKRAFCTPVIHHGKLYIVGGCDMTGKPVNLFDCYNSVSGEWIKQPDMPLSTAQPCVLSVDKYIVVLGGVAVNQDPLDVVQIFDADIGKWKSGDRMREKLLGIVGVLYDGKIVVAGGMGLDTNPKDYLMSYDVLTNKWQALASMPTARYASYAFLVGSKLYVIGGRQGKLPTAAFEVYDFKTGHWRELPPVPTKRVFANYVCGENQIFSIGGLHENSLEGFTAVTEVFDISTEQWANGEDMITERGDFAATYLNHRLVVAGGLSNTGQPVAEAEAYDAQTNKWHPLAPLPVAQCSASQVTFEGALYIIGGLSLTGPTDLVNVIRAQDL